MPDVPIVAIGFSSLFVLFWYFQLFTRFFSTRYFLQVGLLLASGLLGLVLSWQLFNLPASALTLSVATAALLAGIYNTGLAVIKLRESDTRFRKMRKANRASVGYDLPYEYFSVKTDDGVAIRGVMLCSSAGKSDKAIIMCHGAGRNKNAVPIVQTSQIFASRYDVFSFDFRGHMESGGVFHADGDTEHDLHAVIDHVRARGYTKVAVFGWSLGAWTALFSAAQGRKIDAIIACSPPPMKLSEMFFTRLLARLRLLQPLALPGVAVVRAMWTAQGKLGPDVMVFARDIAAIPILLVYNDVDYASKASAAVYEALAAKLPPTTETLHLPGEGHTFDWPNTYFAWTKMLDWLTRNF